MTDFVSTIAQQCRQNADDRAVIASDRCLTYRGLAARVAVLAEQLAASGVAAGSLVAICMPRGADELTAMLAVLTLGAAYVPLDPTHPRSRLAMILSDTQPDAVVAKAVHQLPIDAGTIRSIIVDDEMAAPDARCEGSWEPQAADDALAYVLFTSGSTGRPKGVEITRGAVTNFIESMIRTPGLRKSDVVLAISTSMFDIAVLELFGPLCVGATVHIADSDVARDGRILRKVLEREPISVMQATPTSWHMLVDCGWTGNGDLRMFVGGEALSPDLARQLLRRGELWNLYGPTEATVWATCKRIDSAEEITIGRPIDNTWIYVLDEHGQPVPAGDVGELCIGGAGLARGYLGRPDLTAERFIQNPVGTPGDRIYRTGDLARQRADGEYEYLGRLDHQVKIRGYRLEPGEIEHALGDLDCVNRAVVVKWEPAGGPATLVAYVVPSPGAEFAPHELSRLLSDKLPAYMIPGHYIPMSSFPVTGTRKIDRGALPDPAQAVLPAIRGAHTGPRTDTQRTLLRIWSEVLGQQNISVNDDFFDLGGQSLLAVGICDRIHRNLRVDLPVSVVLERRSVGELAAYIDGLRGGSASHGWISVVPIQPNGHRPPIFCASGNGGNPMTFVGLAEALGEQQPFFGLQHRGVDGVHRPHGSIEAMAQEFINDIRSVQPSGPYVIAGYSDGGLAAYEAARMLLEADEDVELLILFDTERPGLDGWSRRERIRTHWGNVKSGGPGYLVRRIADRAENLGVATAKRIRAGLSPLWPYRFRLDAVELAGKRAAAAYLPRKYPGDVLLFQSDPEITAGQGIAPKQHESNGWSGLVGGRLDVIAVPADHRGILDGDTARFIASEMSRVLSSSSLVNEGEPNDSV